jgi:DNA-binding response OmpR family regulator
MSMGSIMKVAIISDRQHALHEFVRGIGSDLDWFAEPDEFLRQAPQEFWNLVVIDSLLPDLDVREFLQKLLLFNSLVHTAVISSVSEAELFAHCEGLGVLCAVPTRPGWSDGARVMNQLCLFYDMG